MPFTFAIWRERTPAGIVPLPYGGNFEKSVFTIAARVRALRDPHRPGHPYERAPREPAVHFDSSCYGLSLESNMMFRVKGEWDLWYSARYVTLSDNGAAFWTDSIHSPLTFLSAIRFPHHPVTSP